MVATVGVLALQGDYQAHARAVERAGAKAIEVRAVADLESVQGLIIPGGESTTMLKLLNEEKLFEPLKRFGESKPIFGTCAGAILLAKDVINPKQASLELMDIGVERNAYGRQVHSHIGSIEIEGSGTTEAVFIRAPIIRSTGNGVRVLATHRGDPVLVEQGRHLAATFHPELTANPAVHQRFIATLKA